MGTAGHSKIAISLPADDLARIERACKQLKMSRSEFMLNAARTWLERADQQKLAQQYLQGYQEKPEDTEHISLWRQSRANCLVRKLGDAPG